MTISQPGTRRVQEVRYGATAQTITCWPEVDAALVDPSSGATVSIYKAGSLTPTITDAAATEAASHQFSYSLDASNTATWPLSESHIAEFSYTVSSVTYKQRVQFDIVRTPLVHHAPLRVDDLKNAHKNVDAALGQIGITDAGSRFIVEAWEDCLQFVESHGWRPALVTDPSCLVPMLRARSRQLMFRALTNTSGDLYSRMEDNYADEYERALKSTVLKYDASDGTSTSKNQAWAQPKLWTGHNLEETRAGPSLGTLVFTTRMPP